MISKSQRKKGRSILQLLSDYVVLDLETSGLNTRFDDIIEVGALRIRNGKITQRYQKLVKPERNISSFISRLTGITNSMLKSAPDPDEVLPEFIEFIGSDIIVGHNVNFDINFLYDKWESMTDMTLSNDFLDTLRLSRRVLPALSTHKLEFLKSYYRIDIPQAHRSIADCETTYRLYQLLMKDAENNGISFDR